MSFLRGHLGLPVRIRENNVVGKKRWSPLTAGKMAGGELGIKVHIR